MGKQNVVSISEFARLAGVSRMTIMRHLREGFLTGATRETRAVPLSELKKYKKAKKVV